MIDRVVSQDEIDQRFVEFCQDIGVCGQSVDEIKSSLKKRNIEVKQYETDHLIYFVQIENKQEKYFSKAIKKYIADLNNESKIWVPLSEDNKTPIVGFWKTYGKHSINLFGTLGHNFVKVSESFVPVLEYNFDVRKGKIPVCELMRDSFEIFNEWRQS